MWCKMHFFGEAIEDVERISCHERRRGPQNLLDLLPDVFTREEAQQMRNRQGIASGSLNLMLNTWKSRNYIEIYGEELPKSERSRQQYIKTDYYLRR